MKQVLLITSGHVDKHFTKRVISALWETEGPVMFAAADDGLRTFDIPGLRPALLAGDFDTVEAEILARHPDHPDMEVQHHNPVKDNSDFTLTIGASVERGCTEIYVLGALGSGVDHSLANTRLCYAYKERDVSLYSLNGQNHIRCVLAAERHFSLRRSRQWGEYLDSFSVGEVVETKSLKGVRYPFIDLSLNDETTPALTVSNEVDADNAELGLSGDPMTGLLLTESYNREESKWIRS